MISFFCTVTLHKQARTKMLFTQLVSPMCDGVPLQLEGR